MFTLASKQKLINAITKELNRLEDLANKMDDTRALTIIREIRQVVWSNQ